MRTRFIGLSGSNLTVDSCRGDGDGRSIYASMGELVRVLCTDMTIISYQQGDTNFGTDPSCRISFSTGWLRMGLFYTDLSAYNGRTVLAAKLFVYKFFGSPVKPYQCYEVWRTWAELQVTYNDRLTGVPWETPGCEGAGDRDTTLVDDPDTGAVGWYSWDVAVPVTAWLGGIRVNYGLRIWPELLASGSGQFYTDDSGVSPDWRPYWELLLA